MEGFVISSFPIIFLKVSIVLRLLSGVSSEL